MDTPAMSIRDAKLQLLKLNMDRDEALIATHSAQHYETAQRAGLHTYGPQRWDSRSAGQPGPSKLISFSVPISCSANQTVCCGVVAERTLIPRTDVVGIDRDGDHSA